MGVDRLGEFRGILAVQQVRIIRKQRVGDILQGLPGNRFGIGAHLDSQPEFAAVKYRFRQGFHIPQGRGKQSISHGYILGFHP
ncbi:MAG: hypothetical protein BWX80_03584 [Candidatus Hydrogenedentes bacterium ADurb.Bin101]|nr:MAG: hypothetical protein BWX80_03584 [Candidatus Hydrogenedentes bacterium ADurb.Bin101]